MDEGHAALYAAIIGFAAAIIGATVGGWASWRAARHSADAAVRAALEQVKGQAANDLAQWNRQERRQAYGRAFSTYNDYRQAAAKLRQSASTGDSQRELAEYQRSLAEVHAAYSEAVLLGPLRVTQEANKFLRELNEAVAAHETLTQHRPGTPGFAEAEQAVSEKTGTEGATFAGLLATWQITLLNDAGNG